jgi:hypothetical protein
MKHPIPISSLAFVFAHVPFRNIVPVEIDKLYYINRMGKTTSTQAFPGIAGNCAVSPAMIICDNTEDFFKAANVGCPIVP